MEKNKLEITMDKEEACKILSENKRQIDQLIDDCIKVAKASGISFALNIGSVYNTYVPDNALEVEETDEQEGGYITDDGDIVYEEYGVYPGGWQSSMC